MRGHARWLGLAAALALAPAAPSRAQEGDDPDALIARALELRRRGEDARALGLIRRAHAARPDARSLAQLALAEQANGVWDLAFDHLRGALASEDPWIRGHREALELALAEIRRHVGLLRVDVDEEGVWVEVSDRFAGESPVGRPVALLPGEHRVRVARGGRTLEERAVRIVAGRAHHTAFRVQEAARPRALRTRSPWVTYSGLATLLTMWWVAPIAAAVTCSAAAGPTLSGPCAGDAHWQVAMIPVVGPWITVGQANGASGRGRVELVTTSVVTGLLQAVGLVTFWLGAIFQGSEPARVPAEGAAQVSPSRSTNQ